MTIILQHQFWDLLVTDDRFEVGLSFGGVPERLVVPFNAIKSFLDPSVQFGLQFNIGETAAPARDKASAALAPAPADEQQATDAGTDPKAGDETKQGEGAEVVRLDRFRKK
jgi:hypothetical protein